MYREYNKQKADDLQERMSDLLKEAMSLAQEGNPIKWHPTTTTPESDDEKVVVRTKDGQVYFGSTINGRFMDNVAYWMPLPKDNDIWEE